MPCDASSFDVVVFHTTLCHVPRPETALAEAHRVLRRGGWLAIFDGDYPTSTVALAGNDPLQTCVQATLATLVHDRWLVRRVRSLVAAAGFIDADLRSHGYVVTEDPRYFLACIQLGADALAASGTITAATAQALALEAEPGYAPALSSVTSPTSACSPAHARRPPSPREPPSVRTDAGAFPTSTVMATRQIDRVS